MQSGIKFYSYTKEQIETVLQNWFEVFGFHECKKLKAMKHPVFDKSVRAEHGVTPVTKFGKFYTLYRCERAKDDKKPMFFFVIEADRFDVLHLRACTAWWCEIKDEISDMERPQIYIVLAYTVSKQLISHTPINILPCLFRIVSFSELYPRLGSKTAKFGLSYDVKLITDKSEIEVDRNLPLILESDVDAKIVNAMPGDIVSCKRIILEEFPYAEYYFREVKSVSVGSNTNTILPSGVCYGHLKK